MVVIAVIFYSSKIVAELLNNLRENKLKIYKSVFVSSVVSSELFKQKGIFTILNNHERLAEVAVQKAYKQRLRIIRVHLYCLTTVINHTAVVAH